MDAAANPKKYTIKILGPFELSFGEASEIKITSKKCRALIGFLCCCKNMTAPRGSITQLLWSDRGEKQANDSLRQLLSRIRQFKVEFGAPLVQIDRNSVNLPEALVHPDIVVLDAVMDDSDPMSILECVGLWRGELLSGLDGVDQKLDEWLRVERTNREMAFLSFLSRKLESFRAIADHAAVVVLANEIARIDPSSETALRALIEQDYRIGDPDLAQKRYENFVTLLDDQYQIAPSEQTRLFVGSLRTQGHAENRFQPKRMGLASVEQASVEDKPKIIVLPFDSIGAEEELSYVSKGLTEDVTLLISRMREFRVVACQTAAAIADKSRTVSDIVEEMDVDYILSGSVRRMLDGVRFNLNVLHAPSNRQVWGERVHCSDGLSEDVINRFLDKLLGFLTPTVERDYMMLENRRGPQSSAGYDYYLRGKYLIHHGLNLDTALQAKSYLERALTLNPALSIAYGHLIRLYNTDLLETQAGGDQQAPRRKAMHLARGLVELDPLDPHAYISLAWCHLWRAEFDEAGAHFGRAINLEPYDADRLTDIATGKAMLGETDAALLLMERAITMNPVLPEGYRADIAEIQFLRGRYDEALSQMRQLTMRNPRRLLWKAACLGYLGHMSEARACGQEFLDMVAALWVGPSDPDNDDLVDWSLSHLPFRWAEQRQLLIEGLKIARLVR